MDAEQAEESGETDVMVHRALTVEQSDLKATVVHVDFVTRFCFVEMKAIKVPAHA